jgi:annexin A7/11
VSSLHSEASKPDDLDRLLTFEIFVTPGLSSMASEFSGHMKDALIYIARYSENDGQGIQRDAELLEAAMSGMGTKDERLIWRIVRLHWNRPRFEAVKQAYQGLYGKSLRKRVEGETTGKYEVSLRA